jgi:predicted ribosomally synthesized peptide with nif11-like leader
MADNGAKEFLDKIDKDPVLQSKLQDATANFVELGKQHGFKFTQEELHDELRQRWNISKPKDDPDTCTVTAP